MAHLRQGEDAIFAIELMPELMHICGFEQHHTLLARYILNKVKIGSQERVGLRQGH